MSIDEAITAATLNAAYALGRAEDTGSIEVGKRADFVIHAVPNRYHLVYRFGVRRVRTVVAAGKVVVDDGRLSRDTPLFLQTPIDRRRPSEPRAVLPHERAVQRSDARRSDRASRAAGII